VGLDDTTVSGGGASAVTDAAGAYAITVADGSPLTAALSGTFAQVFDQAGATLSATAPAVDGGVTDLSISGTTENALAQVTAYYFTNSIRDYLIANGTALTASLSGSFAQVFDQAGTTLSATAPAVDGGVTDLDISGMIENALA
jgi:regulation of enolase protein 1 (concanavalin A-like superfamily)